VARRVTGSLSASGDWSCPPISRGHVFLSIFYASCVWEYGMEHRRFISIYHGGLILAL
jgi:hypothetical protein